MKDETLCRYFSHSSAWGRQLEQLRKKSLAGYSDGVIQLRDASLEECQAAEGLLGRRLVPPHLRYKISDFERALRASRFAVNNMADFWLRLDGRPLVPNQEQKAARQDAVQKFFAAEEAMAHNPLTLAWLKTMEQDKGNGFQILAPYIGNNADAARWLHWACCALDRLLQNDAPEELALCSYAVSTDPHALDDSNSAGRLLLHALAYWKRCPLPALARDRLALYRQCGLMLDDISCFTVQRGLVLMGKDGQEHPACASFRKQGEFCLLTSSQLSELQSAHSPTGRVYLMENQMVFSSLCRQQGIRHPMICTSGQLREASWQLLDLLAASGCAMYYAGDFDPEGLGIADRLWQNYKGLLHLWHMTPADYTDSLSQTDDLSGSRLSQLEHIQCPSLQPVAQAILRQKQAGYQEALVARYLADLQRAAP